MIRAPLPGLLFALFATGLCACGGGGGGGGSSGGSSGGGGGGGTPALNPVVLSTQSMSFSATGASNAQTLTASEIGYNGNFSASTANCSGIATISPGTSASAFTVTPAGVGTCSFTISDASAQTKSLSITVTTTTIVGS